MAPGALLARPVRRGRFLVLLVAATLVAGCERSCESTDRRALGLALGAHDCPPDVGACIGGEAFVSVGGVQGQGQPCRQLALGVCDRGCVAEGVAVAFSGRPPEAVRTQLCVPEPAQVLGHPISPSGPCTAGETTCREGVVLACGKSAARCERGCATDDVIQDEELDLDQALGLLCQH